jgi:hypothetical protein
MTVKVEYYSDVLCVWAWIAQRRQDELRQHFGNQLELKIRYVNVFGNTKFQIGEKWASRGGFDGFGQPVLGFGWWTANSLRQRRVSRSSSQCQRVAESATGGS